jgi:hypothetical protein
VAIGDAPCQPRTLQLSGVEHTDKTRQAVIQRKTECAHYHNTQNRDGQFRPKTEERYRWTKEADKEEWKQLEPAFGVAKAHFQKGPTAAVAR